MPIAPPSLAFINGYPTFNLDAQNKMTVEAHALCPNAEWFDSFPTGKVDGVVYFA